MDFHLLEFDHIKHKDYKKMLKRRAFIPISYFKDKLN